MNSNNIEFPIINNKNLQEEDFIEWMNEIIRARIKVPFIIVISLSVLFYAIVLLSVLLRMKVVSVFYIALVSICLLIALFFRYIMGRLLGRLRYNQYCLSRNECAGASVFYKDCLEIRAGNETVTRLSYADIRKTILTEHLFIIVFPHLTNCIVRRDGFSKNDFEIVKTWICGAIKTGAC